MVDWGLAALAFAAITGGVMWVVYFAYELWTLEPPGMTSGKPKREHKPDHHRKAA